MNKLKNQSIIKPETPQPQPRINDIKVPENPFFDETSIFLITLNISENKLSTFPKNLPKTLKVLNISKNQISAIPPDLNLPLLEELDISDSPFITAISSSFKFPKLRNLVIHSTSISYIPADIGEFLPNLEVLDLSGTRSLKTLPNLKCPKLKKIDLDESYITSFHPDFGEYLPNLEHLDLKFTDLLRYLPNLKSPKLKFLTLKYSSITSIHPDFGEYLPNLEILELFGTESLKLLPNFKCSTLKHLVIGYSNICYLAPNFGEHLTSLILEELDYSPPPYLHFTSTSGWSLQLPNGSIASAPKPTDSSQDPTMPYTSPSVWNSSQSSSFSENLGSAPKPADWSQNPTMSYASENAPSVWKSTQPSSLSENIESSVSTQKLFDWTSIPSSSPFAQKKSSWDAQPASETVITSPQNISSWCEPPVSDNPSSSSPIFSSWSTQSQKTDSEHPSWSTQSQKTDSEHPSWSTQNTG